MGDPVSGATKAVVTKATFSEDKWSYEIELTSEQGKETVADIQDTDPELKSSRREWQEGDRETEYRVAQHRAVDPWSDLPAVKTWSDYAAPIRSAVRRFQADLPRALKNVISSVQDAPITYHLLLEVALPEREYEPQEIQRGRVSICDWEGDDRADVVDFRTRSGAEVFIERPEGKMESSLSSLLTNPP